MDVAFAHELHERELTLRMLASVDVPSLVSAIDAAARSLDAWLPHLTALDGHAGVAGYVEAKLAEAHRGCAMEWGIWRDGEFVGCVGLNDVQRANDACDLGYWLVPSAEGHGIATRAAERVIAHAFDDLGMHRVSVRCIADNTASRGIPERLGMVEEAVIREAWRFRGEYVDHVVYRFLATEWDARAG